MALSRRQQLQNLLEELLGDEDRVYFQPPDSAKIVYPAIVFQLDDIDTTHADNTPFVLRNRWSITYIDRNPEPEMPNKLAQLPTADFDRTYRADGLNHFVFNIYF